MSDRLKLVHERGRKLLLALTALHVKRDTGSDLKTLKPLNRDVISAAVDLERAVNPQRLTGGGLTYKMTNDLDPSGLSGAEPVVRWLDNWRGSWFPGAEFFGSDGKAPRESVLKDGLCAVAQYQIQEFRQSLDALRSFLDEGGTHDRHDVAQSVFIPTELQQCVLDALEGRALTTDALVKESGVGRRTLFKQLPELKARGLVLNIRRLGYYRPDKPPPELGGHQKGTKRAPDK